MENLNYEQSVKRLEEIVSLLSASTVSLEESLKLFSEGTRLIGQCEKLLNDAQNEIEILSTSEEL